MEFEFFFDELCFVFVSEIVNLFLYLFFVLMVVKDVNGRL